MYTEQRGNVLKNKRVLVLTCTTLYIHINRGSLERKIRYSFYSLRTLVLTCTTLYIHINRGSPERNTVLVQLITDACTHTYYTVYTYQQRVYFLTSPSRLPRPPSWTTPTYYLLPVRRAPVLIPCLTLMTQRML